MFTSKNLNIKFMTAAVLYRTVTSKKVIEVDWITCGWLAYEGLT